jgi:2-hydroxycyclohexanecarboxyl-CoA dehydrogenase
MEEKLVLVAGASGGIGASVCRRLVEDGYRVVGTDLNEEALSGLGAELGERFIAKPADQTDMAAMETLVEEAEAGHGGIHGFVNVTGWTAASRFETESVEYWQKVMNINFMSLLYLAQPVLRKMAERKAGRMVFVASDAARVGTAGQAVYSGAKGAVIALSKSLARENARNGITVNCVAPGPTKTPLFEHEMENNPQMVEKIIKGIPLRRAAEPSDQAAAITFFLSDEAAYITGQTLSVSGGLTMI